MQEKTPKDTERHWFIMLHLEPEMIELLLQKENACRRDNGLPLLKYFVPFRFLPKVQPDLWADNAREQKQMAAESNYLRTALRKFVFICATETEITKLVFEGWNRDGRVHLHFYLSRFGQRLTMPDHLMKAFISLCCEKRQRFSFGPPIEDVSVREVVTISQGPFHDCQATVLDVQSTSDGISITLGIPLFNGETTLTLHDYKPSQIHLPRQVEELMSNQFVENVEVKLTDIIRRRIYGRTTPATDHEDDATLIDLYHYSYIQMKDSPMQGRFRALMLVCATLRGDIEGQTSLTAEILQMLDGSTEAATAEQAYLMAALYIATADADYRTAAKQYCQQHPDSSDILARIMPLVKRMDKKFFRRNKQR